MPITSSSFSPTTGIREKPLRRASDSAWCSVLSRSMNTMSVRGTMTSRTRVSPSSKTEWIIFRSPGSMTRRRSRRSTRPRTSASDASWLSLALLAGVMRLAIAVDSQDSGPSSRDSGCSTAAAASATRSVYRRPMARGTTPITTYPATIMMAAAMRNARQPEPSQCTRAAASRTIAAVSRGYPQQQQRVQVARPVGEHGLGLRRAVAAVLGQLLRSYPRRAPQRHLTGHAQAGQEGQQYRSSDEPSHAGVSPGPFPPFRVASPPLSSRARKRAAVPAG